MEIIDKPFDGLGATAPDVATQGWTLNCCGHRSAHLQVNTEIGAACLTHCDPVRVPDPVPDPARVPVPVLPRAWRPCPAVFLPCPENLASAACAGLPLAVVAAGPDPGLLCLPVEEGLALAPTFARFHLLVAVVVRGERLVRFAEPPGAGWNAGYLASTDFFPAVRFAEPLVAGWDAGYLAATDI